MRDSRSFGHNRRPDKHRGKNAPSTKRQKEREQRTRKQRKIERDTERIERKHDES